MLKQYIINGKQFQYEEGEQPQGAEEIIEGLYQPSFQKKQGAANKARKTPANKAKKAAKK